MYQFRMTLLIILVLCNLSFLSIVKTEIVPVCGTLKDVQGDEDGQSMKLRRLRALCDGIEASKGIVEQEDPEVIPDFDLNQIDSGKMDEWREGCENVFLENDVNQILKRFRRSRFSSSSSGSRSSSSSSSSRSSSSGSSSSGSRFFGGEILCFWIINLTTDTNL